MKKSNNYINFGLLFNGLFLVCNRVDFIPDFFKGFLVGLGITLILIGNMKREIYQKPNNLKGK